MRYALGKTSVESARSAIDELDLVFWEERPEGARFALRHEGRILEGHGARTEEGWQLWIDGELMRCRRSELRDEEGKRDSGLGPWRSPFACRLLEVYVKAGDRVKAGSPLLRMESMKMEQVVQASGRALVESVNARTGESIARGTVVLTLSPDPEDGDEERS